MNGLGDFVSGAIIQDSFFTSGLDQVGSTVVNGTLLVYEGCGTVGTNAGLTWNQSIGGVIGANCFEVDSASYAPASNYQLGFSDGTISGTSVTGRRFRSWSIENRFSEVPPIPTAAEIATAVFAGGDIDG